MNLASLVLGLVTTTISYTAAPVHAAPLPISVTDVRQLESIDEKIDRIATEHSIPTTTLFNLVKSESNFDPNAVGDHGESIGLVQIRLKDHPEIATSSALDPDFALEYAASEIAAGREAQWSVCSCIATAKNLGAKIPLQDASAFVGNIALGDLQKGDLVLFKYKNGLSHVAVFQGWEEGILSVAEGNYHPCLAPTYRLVSPNDPTIIGYWHPTM